jgi:hypothetical protein
MALSEINTYWCNTGILSLNACSGRKVGDPNQVIPATLISFAGIDVEAELERHVDRSPSRAMPYLEGGESTLRLIGARSSCSTNLSNESNRLDIAPPLLTGLPVPSRTPGFALRDRIVPPQTALDICQPQQTRSQPQSPLPEFRSSGLQWQLDITVPLPDVKGSKAAYPPSVSWQSHWKQLG